MNRYEGMFLVDSRFFPKGWEEAQELLKSILQRHGGKVLESGKWDERRLAYEIKRQKRALYLLVYFEAPAKAVGEIERECELTESVLRILILRHDGEIPKDAFRPLPPPEAVAAPPVAEPAPAEAIPELAEIEGSGPVDWEAQ